MKKNHLRDIKAILRNFFIVVFIILISTVFICAVNVSSDRSGYQLTGERQERISGEDIKNSCISFFDMIE